jgi:hypothetical protein
MHGQHSTGSGNQIVMHLKDHNIVIPIDSGPSNLPMVWNPSVSAEEQREIGLTFVPDWSSVDYLGLIQCFGSLLPNLRLMLFVNRWMMSGIISLSMRWHRG